MARFAGKVALVTGASRGIGRAVARQLAREGAGVAVNFRVRAADAEAVCAEIRRCGSEALAVQADVSNLDGVAAMVRGVRKALGPIDLLVSSAAIAGGASLPASGADEWRRMLEVNLSGVYNVCRAVFLTMLKRRSGSIVNLASAIAMPGLSGHTAYGAAKAGVIGFSRCLALEGAAFGVRVNTVAPGLTQTDLLKNLREDTLQALQAKVPMRRVAEAEEIAAAICFLLSEDASYITGQVLAVDGGLTYR